MKARKLTAMTLMATMLYGCGAGGETATVTEEPTVSPSRSRSKSEPPARGGPRGKGSDRVAQGRERSRGTDVAETVPSPTPGPSRRGERASTGSRGAPDRPRAATPAATGTYRYDTSGTQTISGGAVRRLPEVTTLHVEPADGSRQFSTRDLRDRDGYGTLTETVLVYEPSGVHLALLRITNEFGGGLTDVREFRPPSPVMIAPTGSGPGDGVRFTLRGSGTTVRVTVDVLRAERAIVGGRAVDTFVVRTHAVLSGAVEGTQTNTSWIAPDHLLAVREKVTGDVRNGPIRLRTDYDATLRRLGPS